MKDNIKILGIETSCDETSAAIVAAKFKNQKSKIKMIVQNSKITILSNIVASQIDLHKKFGGVYPELASRAHLENIMPVIQAVLDGTKLGFSQINAIAVTIGPGLIGSLLIGVETAKTLAYALNKPLIPVNHLEGHMAANFIGHNPKTEIRKPKEKIEFPIINLIVSGGHTSLVLMKDFGKYKSIGSTRDDAAGEAFDKVAVILGLEYPGGPAIEAAASKCKNQKSKIKMTIQNLKLPRPMINSDDFDFSFSGLKTAVLQLTKELGPNKTKKFRNQIASEFQNAVIDILVSKTLRAAKKYKAKTIMISGGVSANSAFRKKFKLIIQNSKFKIHFLVPPKNLCTDNAAMIAAAAALNYPKNIAKNPIKISASPNLNL